MIVLFQQVVLAEFSVMGFTHKHNVLAFVRAVMHLCTYQWLHHLSYSTAEPELQQSQT